MKPQPTWINGELHPAGSGSISASDAGFLLGLSVFESVFLADATLYFLEDHLERLWAGADALRIPRPLPWDVESCLRAYAGELAVDECIVRITLSRGVPGQGPTLVFGARGIDRPADPGVVVAISSFAKIPGDPWDNLKSTNRLRYVLAREEVRERGAWEGLIPTPEGDVTEGTISNLFAVFGDSIATPPLSSGCLPGVVRQRLLAELAREPVPGRPLDERRLFAADLARAEELFLTNSSGRLLPVVEVQNVVPSLPGSAGHVTAALRARFAAAEERYRSSPGPIPAP